MFNHSNHLRFAEGFSIDLEKKILWFNGTRPEIPTKAVEVLCALVEGNGDVVTREDLLTKVWADSFVEEAVLTQNVYVLRKVFKEHGVPHDLIETVPRRGYRFNAEPEEDSGEFETVTIERSFVGQAYLTEVSDQPNGSSKVEEKRRYSFGTLGYTIIIGAAVSLVVASTLAFYSFSNARSASPSERRPVVRYEAISTSARALYAGLSNSGEYAAYVLHTADNKYSLMLHHIPSKSNVEVIAPQERHLYSIQFSPDGRSIYFGGSKGEEKGAVYRIPTFGGTPEFVTKRPEHHFSISPNGKMIAMYRREPVESAHYLDVCSISNENDCRIVTKVGNGSSFKIWGAAPTWSSDGTKLLVAIAAPTDSSGARQYLAEVVIKSGIVREITSPAWHAVHQAYWSPDGSKIYAMVREHGDDPVQLWSLDTSTGSGTRLTNDTDDYREFRVSQDGKFLIANTWLRAENLFLVSLEDPDNNRQLTFEDAVGNGAIGAKWVNSANEVVFSRSSGNATSLWRLNVETLDMTQLTFDKGNSVGKVNALEDGSEIFYVSDRTGTQQIWRSNRDGSDPRLVTDTADADNPELSQDGNWLYYSSTEGVWKVGLEDGTKFKVLDVQAGLLRVSPADPSMIAAFYFDPAEHELRPWKFGIFREGVKEPLRTFDMRPVVFAWKPDGSGFYFADSGETFSNIWFQPLSGADPERITNFSNQKISNFSLAPDGKSMILSRGISTSRVLKIDLDN